MSSERLGRNKLDWVSYHRVPLLYQRRAEKNKVKEMVIWASVKRYRRSEQIKSPSSRPHRHTTHTRSQYHFALQILMRREKPNLIQLRPSLTLPALPPPSALGHGLFPLLWLLLISSYVSFRSINPPSSISASHFHSNQIVTEHNLPEPRRAAAVMQFVIIKCRA